MPILKTQDNEIYTSIEKINDILYPNHIEKFEVPETIIYLAGSKTWNDELKQKIISNVPAALIEDYRKTHLIHSGMFVARVEMKEELDKKLNDYKKMHINHFDEMQHIINGSVIYGFVNTDGKQCIVILLPGEKIYIKEGSEHWGTVTNDYYATLITYRSVPYGTPNSVKQIDTKILIRN